jgi:NitT/TauT family transport system substrate-binding protein
MTTITLSLDYYHPWSNNVGFYLARARGYYLQHGIDVQIHINDPFRGDSLARVAHHEADFGINYPNRLLVQRERGMAVRAVAAINQCPLEALMTLPQQHITRPRDLEGKRLGVPRSERLMGLLRYLMQRDGSDIARVNVVEYYPPEPLPTDIASGAVDATLGTFWVWEAPLGRLAGVDPVVIKTEELGSPPFHAQLLITREALLEQNPVLVRNFVAATASGFAEAASDTEASIAVLQKAAPYFSRALLQDALQVTAPTWGVETGWGTHRPELLEPYAAFLQSIGMLQAASAHQVALAYTNEVLP